MDSIDGTDLPFPKIEFIHTKRLNRSIKYCIDGKKVDILEKLSYVSVIVHSTISGLAFEDINEVYRTRKLINDFINNKHD